MAFLAKGASNRVSNKIFPNHYPQNNTTKKMSNPLPTPFTKLYASWIQTVKASNCAAI
jgi:hypothetical protein